MRNIR